MVNTPQDIVAIFHCSFHPTRGNVLDWSLTASDDIDLTNVEFSCLPSGLHTIEEDVVYFSRGGHPGLCIFRRRRTEEHGHRGFRLSSLGVLLASPSALSPPVITSPISESQPWLHVASLKTLVQTIYASLEDRDVLEPTNQDWAPAKAWFEEHRIASASTSSANHQLQDTSLSTSSTESTLSPSIYLPSILQASSLGPSLLTISRFLLARRRVLILIKPPVEGACMMCWTIGSLCATVGADAVNDNLPSSSSTPTQSVGSNGPKVLGMVTLHDIDRLQGAVDSSSGTSRGWIACTTDSVFVDKTKCWDLLVDATSCDFSSLASSPSARKPGLGGTVNEGRPKMYVPKGSLDGDGREGKAGKKECVRFAWSDVKLWTDLVRLAHAIPSNSVSHTHSHTHSDSASPSSFSSSSSTRNYRPPPGPSSLPLTIVPPSWIDAGRIYEDACIFCASMWYSSNSPPFPEDGQGRIRLEGEESLPTPSYGKSKSMSVESSRRRSSGESRADSTQGANKVERVFRRVSESSSAVFSSRTWAGKGKLTEEPMEISGLPTEGEDEEEGSRLTAATAISRAFTAYHARLLLRLGLLVGELAPQGSSNDLNLRAVVLSPKDLASLDLGPLSILDARWVEWLADSHPESVQSSPTSNNPRGRIVVRVRRARWKDVLGAVFGFG